MVEFSNIQNGEFVMIFKRLSHKILAILFSASVVISGFLIFFKTYPDNFISTTADALLYSFLKSTSWIKYSIDDFINEIKISREAKGEIDELKDKINILQEQLVDYQEMKRENIRLSDYCNIKKENPNMSFVSASVIGKLSDENIFIDVGKRDGVSKNDAVITKDGFLGRVFRVGDFDSNVVTILSPNIKVGIVDTNTGSIGMLSGSSELSSKNLTRMTLIKYKNSVSRGDILITSGLSGLYPKNLKIGEVESIQYDETSSSYFAILNPYVKVDDARDVYVITSFSGKNVIDY